MTTADSAPRWCFYVPEGQRNDMGYIPSVVTEDEAGHAPLIGQGEHAIPWYWGDTLEEARRVAAEANDARGISILDAAEIVASSMRESIRASHAQERAHARYERIVTGKA